MFGSAANRQNGPVNLPGLAWGLHMSTRVPGYRLHRPSGLAVVTIGGKDNYLGKFGSVESREEYGRLIAANARGTPSVEAATPVTGFSINEVVLAFLLHAEKHYVKRGATTAEYDCFKSAVRPLVELYGETVAGGEAGFSALKLKAVRNQMIVLGWSRKYINKSCGRIRHIFKWANVHEMLGTKLMGYAILESLRGLEPLLAGRTEAVETVERSPVEVAHIEAVRAKVNQRTRDMIDLCLLVGCRPGELVSLTTGIIDRSGDVWTAELEDHKMQHRGKARILAFGPKAQLILRRYLLSHPDKKIFNIRRDTFSKSIVYWCEKLDLPKFTGHWFRHNVATEIRETFDLDAAQSIMGHSDQRTTQIYAHLTNKKAVEIARKRG